MTRTLIIYGLPRDTKQREITNLLWSLPEFESAWLAYEGPKAPPIGVATFQSPRAAASALRSLHYFPFDRDIQLRCELATHDVSPGQLASPQPLRNPAHTVESQSQKHLEATGYSKQKRSGPTQRFGKIFIGNLTSEVSEGNVKEELQKHPGYLGLRYVSRDGAAMCFVEFNSPAAAEEVVGYYSDGFRVKGKEVVGVVELARDKNQKRER